MWLTACLTCCCPTAAHHGPTMWAGTNSGSVFAYALEVPAAAVGSEKRAERAVEAVMIGVMAYMRPVPTLETRWRIVT